MKSTLILIVLMSLAFASGVVAGPKPNFAGTWKLNESKSDNGPFQLPKLEVLIITSTDSKIEVTHRNGERVLFKSVLIPNGVTRTERYKDSDVRVQVGWDNSQLLIDRTYLDDVTPNSRARWFLSTDGKTLTQEGDIAFKNGERTHSILVWDKQP
jgi:hypothetical protein